MQTPKRTNWLSGLKQKGSEWLSEFESHLDEENYRNQRLILGGLITLSLIVVQAFIATGLTDPASYISAISFAIAIPSLTLWLLFYGLFIGYQNIPIPIPRYIGLFWYGSISIDLIGIDAAFWHISWIAGLLFLVSGVVNTFVYGVHLGGFYASLEKKPMSKLE